MFEKEKRWRPRSTKKGYADTGRLGCSIAVSVFLQTGSEHIQLDAMSLSNVIKSVSRRKNAVRNMYAKQTPKRETGIYSFNVGKARNFLSFHRGDVPLGIRNVQLVRVGEPASSQHIVS